MNISAARERQAHGCSRRLGIESVRAFLVLTTLALLFVINSGKTVFAQSLNGLMSGTVFDQHDRALVSVTVRVIDQLNATSQTTETNEDGYFVFAQLRPGKYTLSVEQSGFEKLEKPDIL